MHLVADRAEPDLQGVTAGCGPDELDELCASRLPLVVLMPKPILNPVVRIELPVWGGNHEGGVSENGKNRTLSLRRDC